jgi:hypothetical protein
MHVVCAEGGKVNILHFFFYASLGVLIAHVFDKLYTWLFGEGLFTWVVGLFSSVSVAWWLSERF